VPSSKSSHWTFDDSVRVGAFVVHQLGPTATPHTFDGGDVEVAPVVEVCVVDDDEPCELDCEAAESLLPNRPASPAPPLFELHETTRQGPIDAAKTKHVARRGSERGRLRILRTLAQCEQAPHVATSVGATSRNLHGLLTRPGRSRRRGSTSRGTEQRRRLEYWGRTPSESAGSRRSPRLRHASSHLRRARCRH